MESNENSQLHSQEEKKEDNKVNSHKDSIISKIQDLSQKEKIKSNKKSQEEIEVELVLKNNKNNNDLDKKSSSKNNSSEEQKKNTELTLPKININYSLKPVQENNVNIISNKKIISEENNINNKENKEKEISNIDSSKNNNNSKLHTNKKVEKQEKLLKTFHKIKKALTLACVEFEDNLNRIYYPEKTEEMKNLSHVNFTKSSNFWKQNNNNELNEEQKKKEKECFKKIKNYKSKIQTIQNELNNELMINKADELERLYKQKK